MMVRKSKTLILVFAGLFLLLLGIQVYFLCKTYQVKEREIYRSVHDRLTNYTDKLEDAGRVKDTDYDDEVHDILVQYHDHLINRREFLAFFERNRKNTEQQLSDYINRSFEEKGYRIAARIKYTSVTSLTDGAQLISQPIVLYETKNKVIKPGIFNTGRWETSSTSKTDASKKNSFLVRSRTDFEILNIRTVIFKELILLIICCVILLASVLMLYLFTLKNLIRQQKQVEVLHTVVDNISHEFKTPIATLKIASKALKKDWNTETLLLIDRQIVRLENLMKQLHESEKEETYSIEPEDWSFFIQDLTFTYPEILFDTQISVTGELPFDKNMMETIVKNLCENSIKYGSDRITVHINTTEGILHIQVSDNGQGIAKRELKNIFEKFYRVQSDNIHNTKGLGLGLYFVRNIVEQYNGTIQVASTIGAGTLFTIQMHYES
ncbi:sensor histidine kinase [Chryseobacterium camelliae]|uniref:sensor histidine kinase n=1 Tax=Chryseobacterium camelliae TaxID=1265445 RepID=UPI000C1CA6FF|nr:HAMP domain-containing sensor histidine kinase [Chryseobacterium camelliae]